MARGVVRRTAVAFEVVEVLTTAPELWPYSLVNADVAIVRSSTDSLEA